MIEQECFNDLLYSIPKGVDYTEIIEEVNLEDIPRERVEKLIDILNHSSVFNFFQVFRVGTLLCYWGENKGFEYVSDLLLSSNFEFVRENKLGDRDYEYILSSLTSYRAYQTDNQNESDVREKIYPCVQKIIEYAKNKFFSIARFYYLVESEGYFEYIPLIKDYLDYIIKIPSGHYWDIYDATKLLLKFDQEFIKDLLKRNGKSLSDFNLS